MLNWKSFDTLLMLLQREKKTQSIPINSTTMEVIKGTSSVHVCHMDDSLMTSQHPPPLVGQQTFCVLFIVNSVPENRLLIVF